MTKKRKIYSIILLLASLFLLLVCIKAILFFNAKPNITINYAVEINKFTITTNYDPCQNAFFDYENAAAWVIDISKQILTDENQLRLGWPGDMNENQLKIVKQWVQDNKQAIGYFEEGSKKPYYWQEMPENAKTWFAISNNLWKYRITSVALCGQAQIDALEGQTRKAFNEALSCLRAANHLIKSRKSMEQMVGLAMLELSIKTFFEILYHAKPSADELARLQIQLEEKTDRNLKFDFEVDKLIINDFIQHIFSDDGKGNGHLIYQEAERIWKESYIIQPGRRSFLESLVTLYSRMMTKIDFENRPFFKRQITGPGRKQTVEKFNEIYKALDEFQRLAPWQLHKKGINPEKQLRDKVNNDWLMKDINTFFAYGFIERMKQCEAEQAAVLTTIAILRFKADKGNFPDNLNELITAGYLKELPQDPYNEGALTFKKAGDNFILYSLGPNFKDDGGKVADNARMPGWWSTEGDTVFWPVKTKKENIEK